MKEARKFLNTFLKENDAVVLALSGGMDSMCLLHLLLEEQKKKNFSLTCVHVDHNVRKNSKEEQNWVKKYVETLGIEIQCFTIDNYQKGKFTEEEGRKKRYQFLKKVAKDQNAYLLTAHHADDLLETIFMRLLRGSTLEGYAGLKQISIWDDITIVRPLLSVTKKEIATYIKENKIKYVTDESNEKDTYFRNRIRKVLIPLVEKEEPNYSQKIRKFSQTLLETDKTLKNIAFQKEIQEKNKIIKKEFLESDKKLQEIYLREYFRKMYGEDLKKVTDKHVSLALKMIHDAKDTSKIDFPKEKTLYKNKKYIWLQDKKERKSFFIALQDNLELPNHDKIEKLREYESKSNNEIHLNSKDIKLPLYITTRKEGMRMQVKNLNGTKKISDIFINAHVPDDEKDEIPILVDANSTVLWVCGIKKSIYDLEKNENYDIIYKYTKRKD